MEITWSVFKIQTIYDLKLPDGMFELDLRYWMGFEITRWVLTLLNLKLITRHQYLNLQDHFFISCNF